MKSDSSVRDLVRTNVWGYLCDSMIKSFDYHAVLTAQIAITPMQSDVYDLVAANVELPTAAAAEIVRGTLPW